MFEQFETPVRCRDGHMFTTLWVPLASVKAVRLGPATRWQWCPVGRHWVTVHALETSEMTTEERRLAAATHDRHII